MDQQQTQNIEQATEQLTDSARQSFQMLADRTVALQESNLRLTQSFFQNWIEQLQNQTQGTQEATQGLQEQGQREAFETLSQEATNAYSEFLNSALSFYQEALSTASQVAQGNMQQAAQATQQGMQAGVQAASQAGQQAMEAANQAAQRGSRGAEQAAGQEVRATAAARRRAEEMNVDLAEVEGTGQYGQITVDDVRRSTHEGLETTGQEVQRNVQAAPEAIKVEDLTHHLKQALSKAFPREQVYSQELEGITQALVNSIGWSVLRSASKQDVEVTSYPVITTLVTSDSFGSEWMSRSEIRDRIENTSGLSQEMAEHALHTIETVVWMHLNWGESIVEVEHIGCIKAAGNGGLMIQLAEELQLVSAEPHSNN
jgi:pyruvate/2-oxoglutarate dehydrogenase complex dihydrolipoamide acyltransferase (E2) component